MAQREEAIPAGGGSPKNVLAVRSVLRQAWKIDDAAKAEKLLRNLARRLEPDWEGVASRAVATCRSVTTHRLG